MAFCHTHLSEILVISGLLIQSTNTLIKAGMLSMVLCMSISKQNVSLCKEMLQTHQNTPSNGDDFTIGIHSFENKSLQIKSRVYIDIL